MSKARWIFLSTCTVVLLAVGLALVLPGLHLALRTEVTCGDIVMQPGDQCRNFGRYRSSWLNDYAQQRSRNQEQGFQLAGAGGLALFACGLFVFGMIYARRFAAQMASRESPPQPVDLMRNNTFRISTLVLGTLIGSIYPVGRFLTSDDRDWTSLLTVPVVALIMGFGIFVYPKYRQPAQREEP